MTEHTAATVFTQMQIRQSEKGLRKIYSQLSRMELQHSPLGPV